MADRWWSHPSCRICGSSGSRSSGRCRSPNPIRWRRRARGASFARVTSTPEVAPVSLRLVLRVGELVLDSGMHRRRARDSSFRDLRPCGGSSSLGGAAGEPMTSASVCEASTQLRRQHAHDSMVGKHDLVGSDDMPATLASLSAGSLTWGQHNLKGWFGVRHTLYFDFVGCTLYMCIFSSDTSQHIKRLFYPPMLAYPSALLPILMSGPAPRLKTCLCGDAGKPTRTLALALPLSLSSLNLSQWTTKSMRGEG
jgi:hypothetical protein